MQLSRLQKTWLGLIDKIQMDNFEYLKYILDTKFIKNTWCTEQKVFRTKLDWKPNKKSEILKQNDILLRIENSKAYS